MEKLNGLSENSGPYICMQAYQELESLAIEWQLGGSR